MAKNNYGAAVAAGVTAAVQAQQGIRGPADIFATTAGYAALAATDRWRPEYLRAGLGDSYQVDLVETKPYSCCRKIHASIDGALNLMSEHKIQVEDIRSIQLTSPDWSTSPAFANQIPTSMAAAQFSAPFCVAAALHGFAPGPAWFEPNFLANPDVLATSRKISVRGTSAPDPSQPLWASVAIHSNQRFDVEIVTPRGHPSNPLNSTELEAKFHRLVTPVLGQQVSGELHSACRELPSMKDLSVLVAGLRASAACPRVGG